MDTHSLCLQKVNELYLSIFVIERSDTTLIESHIILWLFLEYVYTYPLLASILNIDWQATGLS